MSLGVRTVLTLCVVLGALALFIDPQDEEPIQARPLPGEGGGRIELPVGDFQPDAAYSSTSQLGLPADLATRGSWLESDLPQGRCETGWYQAQPSVSLMLAGYPALAPNSIEIESRLRDGRLSRERFTGPNPGEIWQRWSVDLPPDAEAYRIVAVDASSGWGGWLAFSEPFEADTQVRAQVWDALRLLAIFALAVALVFGPGVCWFARFRGRACDNVGLVVVGPLLLLFVGVVCWVAGGVVAPAVIARGGVALLLAGVGVGLWWPGRPWHLPRVIELLMLATWCVAGFAVAKANLSTGPVGELYAGTISRTLAVGDRSDSRIAYHVVQIIAQHSAPFSPEAQRYFAPWTFATRGPLAGIISAPVVLATGGVPPDGMPDQPWTPLDRGGFAAYRISLIVLAALAAAAVFAATEAVGGLRWAAWATAVALLSPFFVHELFFTWSKLIAAAWVLVAFVLTERDRPLLAGLMLGAAYLFHPLAALSAPFLGAWLWYRAGRTHTRWRQTARFVLGAAPLVVSWQLMAWQHRDLAELNGQAVFLGYWLQADGNPADWTSWWQSRWDVVANTFVPFHLVLFHADHHAINSLVSPSDGWVHTEFLYWNTMPFALGLPAFLVLLLVMMRAILREPAVTMALWLGPAALLVLYWGSVTTGLMRDGGHVLFLSLFVLCGWTLARYPAGRVGALGLLLLHPALLVVRAADVAFMAFGATLRAHVPALEDRFGWNDTLSLVAATALLGAAVVLLAKAAARVRMDDGGAV